MSTFSQDPGRGSGKLSGYYLPFRGDKLTLMPQMDPVLGKRWRQPWQVRQDEKRLEREAAAVLKYLKSGPVAWPDLVQDLGRNFDYVATKEPLDKPRPAKKPRQPAKVSKPNTRPGGYGKITPTKGNLARTQQMFWSEKLPIESDTVDKYVVQALRTQINVFGMTGEEALDWCVARLEHFKTTSYSDRLTYNPAELFRTMQYAADAIEKDNGYQADKARSNAIWSAVKAHWAGKGIRTWEELLDGGTFRSHNGHMRLVWTRALLDLLPEFTEILHTDPVLAQQTLEKTLRHVHYKSELSLSLVCKILVSCGIKGYS